jgi:hypothetical protein
MNEVAVFTSALRAAVPVRPDPRLGGELVPRLAQAARASTIEAETRASGRGTVSGAGRRSRLALVARVGIAVGLIPLVLAGLAFAGVNLPEPARNAFDSVGVSLPNQASNSSDAPTTKGQPASAGNDVSDAAKSGPAGKGGNSEAAHRHARKQREKARGKALGHSRGKAYGLNDAAPSTAPRETGPPDHSNAGGSSSGGSTKSPDTHAAPQAESHPFPPPQSKGQGH